MPPDGFLALARELLALPEAGERHWRGAAIAAHQAVHHAVAAALGLDPTTFAGNPRAVREALMLVDPAAAVPLLVRARRHLATLWLTRLRAEQALAEPFQELDARLAVAHADAVLASGI